MLDRNLETCDADGRVRATASFRIQVPLFPIDHMAGRPGSFRPVSGYLSLCMDFGNGARFSLGSIRVMQCGDAS